MRRYSARTKPINRWDPSPQPLAREEQSRPLLYSATLGTQHNINLDKMG